jgi:hypothetical protein
MTDGPQLAVVIPELLERLLLDEITRHVPDDDRVEILTGASRSAMGHRHTRA